MAAKAKKAAKTPKAPKAPKVKDSSLTTITVPISVAVKKQIAAKADAAGKGMAQIGAELFTAWVSRGNLTKTVTAPAAAPVAAAPVAATPVAAPAPVAAPEAATPAV